MGYFSWNPQLAFANKVREIGPDEMVLHKIFRAKKCIVEVARDFVYWEKIFTLDNGTVLVLAMSDLALEEAERVEVPDKCVRGHIYASGWVLEPKEGPGGKTHTNVTYLTAVDLKNLPQAVEEMAGREQPYIVRRLAEYVGCVGEGSKSPRGQKSPRSPRSPRGK